MEDWLFISLHRPGQQLPVNIDAFRVRNWQTMIWLTLDQSQPGVWTAIVRRHGQLESLAEIHVIGSGMIRLLPPDSSVDREVYAGVDEGRWSRTRGFEVAHFAICPVRDI